MQQALTYIEIDIPWCTRSYGVAPCTASIGVTGADKCFNSVATCQDVANFNASTVTLRFAVPAAFLPREIAAIPCIEEVDHTPAIIGLDGSLGECPMLRVKLKDHRHSDAGQGFDKYYSGRSYNPFTRGTIFGKLRARQPYLQGAALRWYQGFVGDTLGGMDVRNFEIDSLEGPDPDGYFTIIARDAIKRLYRENAIAPALSAGYLVADITDSDTQISLQPDGIGLTEHPESTGYMCLGGNEIVSYTHDITNGNDANTLLYLKFNGADAATTTVDSSASARTISRTGQAQLDDAQKVFGTTSAAFDGSGDSFTAPDSNDWTFSGDFTIDCFARIVAVGGSGEADLVGHQESSTKRWRLYVHTDGSVRFEILNTSTLISFASAASLLSSNVWYHFAVERYGNIWTLWIDGAVVATTTVSLTVPNFSSVLRIGIGESSNRPMWGWIDNLRISNVARYHGAAFTVPVIEYDDPDNFTIVRAQLGTEASSHQAQDRAQVILQYSAQSAAEIIADLEVNYAGIPTAWVPETDWQAEIDAYQGQVYTTVIPEPVPVKQLVEELCEQAGLAHWWNDLAQQLELRVIRNISADAKVFDVANRIRGSAGVRDQPEKRVSRVQVYYGQIDPTKDISELSNYRGVAESVDSDAEDNYGNSIIRQVKSRFIPAFGATVADRLGAILLARYTTAPRRFNFSVMRGTPGEVPQLGGGYHIAGQFLQDESGDEIDVPFQLTRLKPGAAVIEVEGEEMLAPDLGTDPVDHTIIISSNTNNFNLRTVHDETFTAATGITVVTCIIPAGVTVGSLNTSLFAFDTGSWGDIPGVTLVLDVRGTIEGAGGAGGRGAYTNVNSGGTMTDFANAENGGTGGTALKVRKALELKGDGAVKGGGGGGGGGGCGSDPGKKKYGGAAGGGAGVNAGAGGALRDSSHLSAGDNGTASAGGSGKQGSGGGFGANGGAGGAPGSDGVNGSNNNTSFSWNLGGTKGSAGKSIDGDSNVTETGTVTVTGPRV